MIDLHIDLFAVPCSFAAAKQIVCTSEGSQIAITRRIQSISDFIVVRHWIESQRSADIAGGIQLLAEGIPLLGRSRGHAVRYQGGGVDRSIRAVIRRRLALERAED